MFGTSPARRRGSLARAAALALAFTAAVGQSGVAPAAAGHGDDAVWRRFYREDANAQFEITAEDPGSCPSGRTLIETHFLHHLVSGSEPEPPRGVLFSVGIQEFACDGTSASFVASDPSLRRFDVWPRLAGTKVRATLEACSEDGSGTCFPVRVELSFAGAGAIDVQREENNIHEPDCTSRFLSITRTRSADVHGTITYALPGGDPVRHHVDGDDLGPFGANLQSFWERSFRRGDGPACRER